MRIEDLKGLNAVESAKKIRKYYFGGAIFSIVTLFILLFIYFILAPFMSKHYILYIIIFIDVVSIALLKQLKRQTKAHLIMNEVIHEACDPAKYVEMADYLHNKIPYKNNYKAFLGTNYAMAKLLTRDYEKTIEHINIVETQSKLYKKNAFMQYCLNNVKTSLYMQMGDIEKAKLYYSELQQIKTKLKQKVIIKYSIDALLLNIESQLAYKENRFTDAEQLIIQSMNSFNKAPSRMDNIVLNYNFGNIELALGKYKEASDHFEIVLELGQDAKVDYIDYAKEKLEECRQNLQK